MFHFGPIWGIKDEESMEKTFIRRRYTIVLKFWDEFNANFVLLYFSSYWSITIWNLFPKMSKKNKKIKKMQAVHLSLLWTYLHQILFNIKKYLAWALLKKNVHLVFCVFHTILNKAVNIFWTLPKWIRKLYKRYVLVL